MTNSTVGEKIKYIRYQNNLSQFKFASEIGVSESTVFRWEVGERTPSKPHAKKICEKFDVPQDWFLEVFDTEMFDPATKTEQLKKIDTSTVGGRVQFLRLTNEMSLGQFADEFAVKPIVVSRWETNKSKPQGPKAMKIADKFGVSLRWLLSGDFEETVQNVETSNFGARIKFLRERSKMSHRVFASKIGVSPYIPSRWEKDYIPSKTNLKKIAELFNVSVDWLRDGVGTMQDKFSMPEMPELEKSDNLTSDKQYVLGLLSTLSDERQGRLLGYLDALYMEELITEKSRWDDGN